MSDIDQNEPTYGGRKKVDPRLFNPDLSKEEKEANTNPSLNVQPWDLREIPWEEVDADNLSEVKIDPNRFDHEKITAKVIDAIGAAIKELQDERLVVSPDQFAQRVAQMREYALTCPRSSDSDYVRQYVSKKFLALQMGPRILAEVGTAATAMFKLEEGTVILFDPKDRSKVVSVSLHKSLFPRKLHIDIPSPHFGVAIVLGAKPTVFPVI